MIFGAMDRGVRVAEPVKMSISSIKPWIDTLHDSGRW